MSEGIGREPRRGRLCEGGWLALGMAILLLGGCRPGTRGVPQESSDAGALGAPCGNPGEVRRCGFPLDNHAGVLTCYVGTQTCSDGVWSACTGGDAIVKESPEGFPEGPASTFAAITSSVSCPNNPCDPSCQVFNEHPDASVVAEAGKTSIVWPGGSLTGIPSGLVNQGLKEPCATGADCQFNRSCQAPVTGSGCAHSKCLRGTGLASACDSCVASICATKPGCCAKGYTTTCSHDPCSTGGRLKSTCDTCVAKVCAKDSYCCSKSGAWDSQCVGEIPTYCGLTCPLGVAGTWDQSCVDAVATTCDATCDTPVAATCYHSMCSTGTALQPDCHECVAKICAKDPSCCIMDWDSTCVGYVDSVCNEDCPSDMLTLPSEDGTCQPWLPGQTDSSCSGIDLAGGIPCDTKIPVCNHGTKEAPAGIRVVHFPANSGQYPKCAPDQSHPQMKECFTTQPIAPGTCVTANCPELNGNREVMVNPPGTAHLDECSCQDNWTLYSSGNSCVEPVCSGSSAQAVFRNVNLLFVIDRSGSMLGAKWTAVTGALKGFFQSSNSAGLRVALEAFPLASGGSRGDGCAPTSGTCSSSLCANPMVPAAGLTTAASPTDAQEKKLIDGLAAASPPEGGTPSYPALDGALTWAENGLASAPSDVFSVVFVSDGEPTWCNTDTLAIGKLALARFQSKGIRTYSIAMDGADITFMNRVANAGGTGSAFVIDPNKDMGAQLAAVFQAIAKDQAPCSFDIVNAENIDPTDAKVVYYPGSGGAAVTLSRLANSAACGKGWYYNSALAPTTAYLCPETCSTIQADLTAKMSLEFGCRKPYANKLYSKVYQGSCPADATVQWGLFTYVAHTPADSKVEFRARTASTEAGLAMQLFRPVATAARTPVDTQTCSLFGPSGVCPVSMYNKLGGLPDARRSYLEVQTELYPSSNLVETPALDSWEVTFSCVQNQ